MLTLVSFMMLVFLGLTAMTHEQNGRMQGGCPFSAFGASLCPQDTFAVVFHKMFAYQSLFSIPTQFGAVISIISFLFVLLVAFTLVRVRLLESSKSFEYSRAISPSVASYRKITRWLSLFENSPSL